MEFDTRAAHRKSRAPWKAARVNNPYANANAHQEEAAQPNPYVKDPQATKRTRRLSIHASASAAAHTKNLIDAANLPPVPSLPPQTAQKMGRADTIDDKIAGDLSNATATEIDDYFKVLAKKKEVVTRDLKNNVNANQKNILELMNDLKDTQDELLQLRISTKELYEVLDAFKDAAERRLELDAPPADTRSPYGQTATKSKRKDRSSIVILEKMWVNELKSLFKHVEGASKFIQAIPGRHILAESGRWFEVNMGTFKPTKATHIFVLNDLILIATKKSSAQGKSQSRLQAVHCWPLGDLQLQAILPQKATSDENKTYMINITYKSLTYLYLTDRYDHFLKISDAYSKGKNELLQRDRLLGARRSVNGDDGFETDDEKKQLRDSLRNSGVFENDDMAKRRSGTHRNSAEILLQDISARVHSRNRSHDFSANGKYSKFSNDDKGAFFSELRRIEDRLDEVDVEIAHNKFHEAVGLINYIEGKLRNIELIISKTNTQDIETISSLEEVKLLIDVIKLKLSNRKIKVQHALSFNIQHNISKLRTSELAEILEFFHSFGVLDKGISTFLKAVSADLSNTVSRLTISVQGSTKTDVVNYLSNLVIVTISIMKRTIATYKECIFPILQRDNDENVDSSGLVNWCIEEGQKLLASVKKQLYGTLIVPEDPDDESNTNFVVKDAELYDNFVATMKPHLASLKGVGINIDYLFDDILAQVKVDH